MYIIIFLVVGQKNTQAQSAKSGQRIRHLHHYFHGSLFVINSLGEIQRNVNGLNCTKSYVLCEARCCLCNVTYIGATAGAFHTRARARFYNVRRQDREESALADHFVALHPKNIANPAIDFKALCGLIELTIANLSKNGAVLA